MQPGRIQEIEKLLRDFFQSIELPPEKVGKILHDLYGVTQREFLMRLVEKFSPEKQAILVEHVKTIPGKEKRVETIKETANEDFGAEAEERLLLSTLVGTTVSYIKGIYQSLNPSQQKNADTLLKKMESFS